MNFWKKNGKEKEVENIIDLLSRGDLLLTSGKYEDALTLCERVLHYWGLDLGIRLTKLGCLQNLGRM
ncbi:MAG: hypothetical protein E6K93_01240 [Thaumarchaeota archaeon]|nr:MAG: hypothetical protein E6K93_01240 [Nitrososphaerota archaeon]